MVTAALGGANAVTTGALKVKTFRPVPTIPPMLREIRKES
jgi:hypothetical protein